MTSTEPVPDLQLRPAAGDDLDAICEVYLAARQQAPMPPLPHSEEATRQWLRRMLQGRDETWVAEADGLVVGYARFTDEWLDDLYVAPASSGHGVGTALLDLVKSLRPDGFCLWVFETNQPARDFYAARGLVELQHGDGRDTAERAPDVQVAWPGEEPLAFLRHLVDQVDADLGDVLARRAALTHAIQGFKPVGGRAGRDPAREREIASRLADRAPALGPDRLQRILQTIITETLDAAD